MKMRVTSSNPNTLHCLHCMQLHPLNLRNCSLLSSAYLQPVAAVYRGAIYTYTLFVGFSFSSFFPHHMKLLEQMGVPNAMLYCGIVALPIALSIDCHLLPISFHLFSCHRRLWLIPCETVLMALPNVTSKVTCRMSHTSQEIPVPSAHPPPPVGSPVHQTWTAPLQGPPHPPTSSHTTNHMAPDKCQLA